MASPSSQAPSPQENGKSSKLTYYYFVFGLTLVAIALLFANGVFLSCFSWIRRFWATRGLGRDLSEEEMRRWIPVFRYMKKGTGGEDGEDGDSAAAPECVVCISAFEEGDELRRLPQCGHSFHAVCIDMWLSCHSSCPVCRGSVFRASMPSVSMEFSAQLRDNLNPRPPAASGGSVDSV